MTPNSLHDLYLEQLKGLYDAEQQIIKATPEMIDAATSQDLKQALSEHLEATHLHAERLEQIFSGLGVRPKGEKCKGMEGVIEEGSDLVGDIDDASVRDAAIVASAQCVEHYEMAGYGTARSFASLLGQEEASRLLQQTLDEEKEADQRLTMLSSAVNVEATPGEAAVTSELRADVELSSGNLSNSARSTSVCVTGLASTRSPASTTSTVSLAAPSCSVIGSSWRGTEALTSTSLSAF